jgi:type II secretory pathway pseudopilin PulG
MRRNNEAAQSQRRAAFDPRGIVLLEACVTLAIIAAAIALGISAWRQGTDYRRAYERREAAREAVTLALERLRSLDPAALPKAGSVTIGLPPGYGARLPGGTCEVLTKEEEGGLLRVRVEVRWTGAKGVESGETLLPRSRAVLEHPRRGADGEVKP